MTYPLSQTQMGIYVTCLNTQEEGNYNLPMLYKLDEDVDVERLARALDKVIEAHPYVKSRLVTDDEGEVVFEDHSEDVFRTSVSEVNDIEEVRPHLGEDFDLLHDQLFRIEIYKIKPTPNTEHLSPKAFLYVDFHHIVFDGMSYHVFSEDLAKAYDGVELVKEPVSGFEIAEKELADRKSEVYEVAKEWYAKEFGGASEVDSMPLADKYSDDDVHYSREWIKLNVDREAIGSVCDKAGVKESMLFSAAFGVTLSKFTAEEEVLYNTGYHGRTDKATRHSLCMMVKTLPVYHNLAQTRTVMDLLKQTSEQINSSRRYSVYSYGDIATEVGVKSDINFVYQGSLHTWDITLEGRKQESESLVTNTPGIKFLSMIMIVDGEYYAWCEYQSNKYSREFIEGFWASYEHIVGEMCVKENIADIEVCNNEQIAMLDAFNDPVSLTDEEQNATVVSMFRKMVALYPDNTAVVFKDKKYTYRELDEVTDRIAVAIRERFNGETVEHNVETVEHNGETVEHNGEAVVSIIIHRNEWMVLASLAALKAGCAYQPLDPSYPQDRLNFMVKDADAVLLIADPGLRDIVDEYDGEVLLTSEMGEIGELGDPRDGLGNPRDDLGNPRNDLGDPRNDLGTLGNPRNSLHSSSNTQYPTPNTLLTLLYTSGSTGVPKGVMLEHQNLVAYNKFYKRYYDVTPESKIAAYASFGFDANMQDIYCALMNGATLHIIDDDIRLDLEALHQYFEREGITISFMTTQVGVQYLESYPKSSSLKHLSMGGEKLRAVRPEELSYKIHNGYGPSETTCGCSFFHVKHWEPNIPVGTPTDTVSLYVVDKHGHRVPAGAAGELWISGPQVGRGYLNRPDKTAEAFFELKMENGEWKFDSANTQRAYRSGDIVRYREDGNIEFVGRKDGQVKIRGFRIELKEVEAVIREFEGVKDVTVQAFDDPNGGKYIAAYIVSSDQSLDTNALNQFILDQKPPYMVPAVTMLIDKIPLNVNQKVDKKALPKPEPKHASGNTDALAAPLNALEVELYNMVAGIVNVPPLGESEGAGAAFGITDVLGYVGLTSISSIKLATLIYKKYGVQVNAKTLAKTGTLQSIENEILQYWMKPTQAIPEGGVSDTSVKAIHSMTSSPRGGREGALLSFTQQGVYVDSVNNADSVIYNIPVALQMPAGVTVEQLDKALRDFVAAHPYINCHFGSDDDGNTVQLPIDNEQLTINNEQLTINIPVKEMTAEEFEQEKKDFVRPFNLAEGPCYRFEIVKVTTTTQHPSPITLLADFHHLISDGASVDLFMNQLCQLLDGEKIEPETYDYYSFAREQKITDETEAFFERQLSQIEEASALLPDIYPADLGMSESDLDHRVAFVGVPSDLKSVERKCSELGITPAALYLAATMIAVSKYTAENTVGICTISNGRSDVRISDTMGMFVNTLPVVSVIDPTMPVDDYLKSVADTFAETIANENYPFARIAEKYGFADNIMYAYQVGVINNYRINAGELTVNSLELEIAKNPVSVNIEGVAGEKAEVQIEYDSSMFTKEMMTGLAQSVSHVAAELLSKKTLADIEVCDDDQIALLDSFNNPVEQTDEEKQETVLSAFQKAARQYPDHIAGKFKDKEYTYRELDELTSRIAFAISEKLKVKSEKFNGETVEHNGEAVVSIIIPRNEYMFILPLAVMKAGCAYQPLDPSYPQDRLNFMVKDANAVLLIADPGLRDIVNEYDGEVLLTSELGDLGNLGNPRNYLGNPRDDLGNPRNDLGNPRNDLGTLGDPRNSLYSSPNTHYPSPNSLLILLYTSGSTGVPKGVMLEHRNVMAYIRCFQKDMEMTPDSVMASYASFGFDACMEELYSALTLGATVCLIPEEIRLNIFALRDFAEENGVSYLDMTTQVGQQFALNVEGSKTVKHLILGGEKMMAMEPHPDFLMHNTYGPTECAICVTLYPVRKYETNIPIGKPTTTTTLKIVDNTSTISATGPHRLPVGAAGELWVNGPQVSRGYLNRPDKTAESFVMHEGKRWYRTGDIVRYRKDGNIEFVGRKDGQVKIRGFRIELKEVEEVIHNFPGVKDVTVQAFDYEDGGKFIAAYVVMNENENGNGNENFVAELNEFIKSQKPPYMVPAVTMLIDEIPLNVNQKVDKKALPKPEVQKAEYVAPKNETEKTFCEIFQKVLGLKQVSATDDFFEIGGSSIIALELVVTANKAGYDIVYNDVFNNTTPQMLAEFITGKANPEDNSEAQQSQVSTPLSTGEGSGGEASYIGPDGYDYRPLNALLKQNTLDAFRMGERREVGDVLLTGATGFLGIHILNDLITNYDGKIYCLVRPKAQVSGEKRLKSQLFYYFEHNYNELFGKRVFVIEGDATSETDMKNIDCRVDTVINCAACVKHFAKGNEIENTNVGSVRNLIAWCIGHGTHLVHVSTSSVAGSSVNNFPPADTVITEQMFYFGQTLDNQYIHSKFMAERLILEAILHHGLQAKIMRVGNLSARNVDGEFQINFRSNNFMNMLQAFQFMGVVPYSMQDDPTEFSPIDDTAHAILLLAQSPKECVVLHPFNVHKVLFGDVIRELEKYGNPINMVEEDEFGDTMQRLMEDPENIDRLRSLMAYKSDSKTMSVILGDNSSYTSQLLYRMGYCWPITTWDYVQRFIKAIGGMGMFESK